MFLPYKKIFLLPLFLVSFVFFALLPESTHAVTARNVESIPQEQAAVAPHRAIYDIELVSSKSGSQIVNVSGKMFYELNRTCDAWTTDHRFNLFYEYSDTQGVNVTSDFSTFEPFDGKSFDFTAKRKRDGHIYQRLRGKAEIDKAKNIAKAEFTMPEGLVFQLKPETLFPMAHTLEVIKKAKAGQKFFSAPIFDGSDDEGPVTINTFIGKKLAYTEIPENVRKNKNIDKSLIKSPAWKLRMAAFPENSDDESSDYEMSLIFHNNSIISDMMIDYADFSISQRLVALEPLKPVECR